MPVLQAEVLVENDDFRRAILYSKEIDVVFHKYYKLLQVWKIR